MLDARGLANAMMAGTQNKNTASDAVNGLWSSMKNYIQINAEVIYSWSAVDPKGSPDPTTTWTGKLIPSGTMTPSGKGTPQEAVDAISETLNSNFNSWKVEPAPGFSVSGGTLTGSSVKVGLSGASDRDTAFMSIAADIIKGIKAATPPVMSGAHGAYTGATTSGKII